MFGEMILYKNRPENSRQVSEALKLQVSPRSVDNMPIRINGLLLSALTTVIKYRLYIITCAFVYLLRTCFKIFST